MGPMGKALGENMKIETLSIRDCKARERAQIEFWRGIKDNRSLRVMNLERNRVTDKVASVIAEYIIQEGIVLTDLNLSKNLIA